MLYIYPRKSGLFWEKRYFTVAGDHIIYLRCSVIYTLHRGAYCKLRIECLTFLKDGLL